MKSEVCFEANRDVLGVAHGGVRNKQTFGIVSEFNFQASETPAQSFEFSFQACETPAQSFEFPFRTPPETPP